MRIEDKSSEEKPAEEQRPREKKKRPSDLLSMLLIILTAAYLLFMVLRPFGDTILSHLETFNTVFVSILIQAFPFMLIGILVSSALHIFVPSEWIIKVFPAKHGLGFLTALFAGIFFPVCECAIVPVMARLVKKGVFPPIAVTFMLSAPIINPIAIISTLYAFPNRPEIALMRVGFGLLIALLTGLTLSLFDQKSPAVLRPEESDDPEGCQCCCESPAKKQKTAVRIKAMLLHAGDEFFTVGKYLVIGACLTSVIQTFVPKSLFENLNAHNWLALLIMMAFAFLFSACSTSDAFIARSFMNRFSAGAVMGFMVFGPMMDVKNLLLLLSNFKKGFVLKLTLIIFAVNFIALNLLTTLFL